MINLLTQLSLVIIALEINLFSQTSQIIASVAQLVSYLFFASMFYVNRFYIWNCKQNSSLNIKILD